MHRRIGVCHLHLNRPIEAMKSLEEALQMSKAVLASDLTLADCHLSIGDCQHRLQCWDHALACYIEALRYREARLPPDHPLVVQVQQQIEKARERKAS